jgi:hypothetical protein
VTWSCVGTRCGGRCRTLATRSLRPRTPTSRPSGDRMRNEQALVAGIRTDGPAPMLDDGLRCWVHPA